MAEMPENWKPGLPPEPGAPMPADWKAGAPPPPTSPPSGPSGPPPVGVNPPGVGSTGTPSTPPASWIDPVRMMQVVLDLYRKSPSDAQQVLAFAEAKLKALQK